MPLPSGISPTFATVTNSGMGKANGLGGQLGGVRIASGRGTMLYFRRPWPRRIVPLFCWGESAASCGIRPPRFWPYLRTVLQSLLTLEFYAALSLASHRHRRHAGE